MISEIAAWLFAVFVVDPLHTEIRQRAEQMNLPARSLQQAQQCVTTQGPKLLERAGADPVWAVTTAVGMTIGWTSPVQLIDTRDPNCAVLAGLLQNRDSAETEKAEG